MILPLEKTLQPNVETWWVGEVSLSNAFTERERQDKQVSTWTKSEVLTGVGHALKYELECELNRGS